MIVSIFILVRIKIKIIDATQINGLKIGSGIHGRWVANKTDQSKHHKIDKIILLKSAEYLTAFPKT
jgi:hypothetical protein